MEDIDKGFYQVARNTIDRHLLFSEIFFLFPSIQDHPLRILQPLLYFVP